MKRLKPIKILVNSLLIVSLLVLNPIGANAEWRQNSIGWWFTEGNSWSVGWRVIDEKWYYFGQDGYMKTGWLQDSDGKWYYLNSDGSMAHDTTIDWYTIGSDGARNQSVQSSFEQSTTTENILSNANLSHTTISGVTGVKFDDITKIVFSDGRGRNKPVIVEDKQKIREFMEYLNGYGVKKTENPESIGWIYRGIFYINDKEVMDITFINPIVINRNYFNITEGELDTATIGKFLKSIDPYYDVMAGL